MYKRRQGKEPVLVVPRSLIREVISPNHDPVYAAHPGWKRTLDVLTLRNWWPGMHKDVSNSGACQRRSGKRELKGPLGTDTEPSCAFQVTHCDIVAPFPLYNSGNRYVLTFVDKLSTLKHPVSRRLGSHVRASIRDTDISPTWSE
jgi:hypothetical protein